MLDVDKYINYNLYWVDLEQKIKHQKYIMDTTVYILGG